MIRRLIAISCVLALTACGGSDDPRAAPETTDTQAQTSDAPEPNAELESAVTTFSEAFLSGDGGKAYELLSKRCRNLTPLSDFAAITEQAKNTYGPVKINQIEATVDGDQGVATYTYPVATLNQTGEPWINENGWKNDDC